MTLMLALTAVGSYSSPLPSIETGTVPNQSFDVGTGNQTLDVSSFFTVTTGVTYAVISGATSVDAAGVVTWDTDAATAVVNQSVSIRATAPDGATGVQAFTVDFIQPVVIAVVGQSNAIGFYANDGGTQYPAGTLQVARTGKTSGGTDGQLVPAAEPLDHYDAKAGVMGPALQFVIDYQAAYPEHRVILFPGAKGGSGFSQDEWGVGNTYSTDFITRMNTLMAANTNFVISAILWHQGEDDAVIYNSTYQAEQDAQFGAFRSGITGVSSTTPILVGGLVPDFISQEIDHITINHIIEDTPQRLGYTGYANSEGLTDGGDDLHFNAASQRVMGSRYFAAYQNAKDDVVPDVTAPDAPTGLSATSGAEQVTLSWLPPVQIGGDAITDYVIERSIDGGAFVAVADGTSTARTLTDTGLTDGLLHAYRVAAVNAAGTGAASATASATPAAAPAGPTVEAGAVRHWVFGDDNAGDTDLVASAGVTTTATLTRSPGYLSIPSGQSNGLDTGVVAAAEQTMIFVVRRPSIGNAIIGGTLEFNGGAGSDGQGILCYQDDMWVSSAGSYGIHAVTTTDVYGDNFSFVALSTSAIDDQIVAYYSDQSGGAVTFTDTPDNNTSGRNLGIGNLYYNDGTWEDPLDFAEVIIFNDKKSVAELDAIYSRSAARLAGRVTLD